MGAYLVAILIVAGIYTLLSLGLVLQYGLTGLINFGTVGFFAIGAYTSALLSLHGVPIPLGFAAAAVLAGVAAWPIGLVALRLREDYFAIVTLGFSEVVRGGADQRAVADQGGSGSAGHSAAVRRAGAMDRVGDAGQRGGGMRLWRPG